MTSNTKNQTAPKQAGFRRLIGPGLIVAVIGVNLTFIGVTLFFALSDPSVAVEPDYYEKALAWDDISAQQRASDALHWTATVATRTSDSGDATIEVVLFDRNANEISGAAVSIEAFPAVRSRQRVQESLQPQGMGRYTFAFKPSHHGMWEIRLRAVRGDDIFVKTFNVLLEAAP